jgi:hypothetical protein
MMNPTAFTAAFHSGAMRKPFYFFRRLKATEIGTKG